jgi:hypothetical protein
MPPQTPIFAQVTGISGAAELHPLGELEHLITETTNARTPAVMVRS